MRIYKNTDGRRIGATAKAGTVATVPTAPVDSDPDAWRRTAFQSLQAASEILSVSVTSVYRLQAQGMLKFRSIAGRTVVGTPGLRALVDADEPWAPSKKGAVARAARAEYARREEGAGA